MGRRIVSSTRSGRTRTLRGSKAAFALVILTRFDGEYRLKKGRDDRCLCILHPKPHMERPK